MEKDVAEMDPKDLPDVRAFQDDFTREFMTSIEPVEDGYYEFESKTGGYTMKFPENASIDKGYYERKKDTFELLSYAEKTSENHVSYYVNATYNNFYKGKESRRLLYLLSGDVNYDGDYEEFEHQNNTIFFATSKSTTKSKKTTWYEFFGLVKSNNSNQSLRFIYSLKCEEPEGNCAYDFDAIEQKVKSLMNSVNFKDVKLEEE